MRCLLFFAVVCVLLVSGVYAGRGKRTVAEDNEVQQLRVELDNLSIAALVNILEQQGMHIGDDYYSKEELVEMILQLVDNYNAQSSGEQGDKEASAEPINDNDERTLQPDAPSSTELSYMKTSTWELVKQQVRSELAPFILLIPQPVKTYLAHEVPKLLSTVQLSVRGAAAPMLSVVAKVVRQVGYLLLHAAEKLEVLQRMSALEQNTERVEGVSSSSSGKNKSSRKPSASARRARGHEDEREVEL
jgi:hypothetical protein